MRLPRHSGTLLRGDATEDPLAPAKKVPHFGTQISNIRTFYSDIAAEGGVGLAMTEWEPQLWRVFPTTTLFRRRVFSRLSLTHA
jgi:hypothetical protein